MLTEELLGVRFMGATIGDCGCAGALGEVGAVLCWVLGATGVVGALAERGTCPAKPSKMRLISVNTLSWVLRISLVGSIVSVIDGCGGNGVGRATDC